MAKKREPMSYPDIMTALRAKYQEPEWALLFEVRNQTGFSSNTVRTADAVAVNLYPSKGMYLHGFEVKRTRQDLMNDLRNPDKHKEIAGNCHFWWLIVADESIIKDGELPERWGLMVPRGKNLIIRKQAPLREHNGLPMKFVGSLLRSALHVSPAKAEIKAAVDREVENAQNRWKENHKYDLSRLNNAHGALKDAIREFEEASGVKIDTFRGRRVGEAVKFVMSGGLEGVNEKLDQLKSTAEQIITLADEGMQSAMNPVGVTDA